MQEQTQPYEIYSIPNLEYKMTATGPPKRNRRSMRLKGDAYAQAGAYFVTIVVQGGECALGTVSDGKVDLNRAGKIIQAAWEDLPRRYPQVVLGEFCVMPNHLHAVIILSDQDGGGDGRVASGIQLADSPRQTMLTAANAAAPQQTRPSEATLRHGLPEIVRAFKSISARRINQFRRASGSAFWQRNYSEEDIRDVVELLQFSATVRSNPAQWDQDHENPDMRLRR